MSTDPNVVTSSSGVTVSSSEPITKEEREYLTRDRTAKPIPPDAKPNKGGAGIVSKDDGPSIEVESVDEHGKTHGKDGKYKGNGKAAKESEKQEAKSGDQDDKDEAEASEKKKHDAQSRIRDLAEQKNRERQRAEAAEARLAKLEREAQERAKPADVPRETKPRESDAKDGEKPRPRLKDYAEGEWDKYEDDTANWHAERAERAAAKMLEQRERERYEAAREEEKGKLLRESVAASDKAIAEAGGAAFLDKVAPTMGRIMPSFEAQRVGLEIKPIHLLGDFVVHSGDKVAFVMEYIHETDPGIVDRFEEIGRLPTSRQPLAVERELGMLYGALKASYKAKASATTDNSGPGTTNFKPRAVAPPPPVGGSPAVAEKDLSKIEDFGEYMRAKGHTPPPRR